MQLEVISREPESASNAHATPILFVHPLGHAAWCWSEHFLPYIAHHGYASYALSLRGHGASEGREQLRWTSLADYVADVAQVASQLPRPPILVGDSLGGVVVRKYLESHAAPAAVLMSPASRPGAISFSLGLARRHPLVFCRLNAKLSVYPLLSTAGLYREVFYDQEMPEEQVRQYQARLQDDSYRVFAELLLGLGEPRRKPTNTPVLVLCGAKDKTFPRQSYEAIARGYHTRPEILPELPHGMVLHPCWQLAADRMLHWLQAQGL